MCGTKKRRIMSVLGSLAFKSLAYKIKSCVLTSKTLNRGLEEDIPLSYFPRCKGLTAQEQQERLVYMAMR